MVDTIKNALRAAIFQAIAAFGEKEARRIIEQCFNMDSDDHWNGQR